MFTGIIQQLGTVRALRVRDTDAVVELVPDRAFEGLELGESVAVAGVCLTVVSTNASTFQAEMSRETLSRTTLGRLKVGARVNLERALRLQDRLGGHLVQGHVDQIIHLRAITPAGEHVELAFEKPGAAQGFLVEKGSVALDGVSLTVARDLDAIFTVSMLRYTLQETSFRALGVGDAVNAEWDLIAKYVAKQVGLRGGASPAPVSAVDEDFLRRHGFN
jgi:riboflavin synthase